MVIPVNDASPDGFDRARLLRPAELGDDLRMAWRSLRESSPVYQSPYFDPGFVDRLAVFQRPVRIGVFERRGEPVAFWPVELQRPGTAGPPGGRLGCLHGILASPGERFDARSMASAIQVQRWHFDHLAPGSDSLAPFISRRHSAPYLEVGDGFDAYLSRRAEAGCSNQTIKNCLRKKRKAAREIGEVTLDADSRDLSSLEALLHWKKEQMKATHRRDLFVNHPWIEPFGESLLMNGHDTFRGSLSVLKIADRPAAAFFALRSAHRLHGIFLGYDDRFKVYSPGIVLLMELARQASSCGVSRIDLGKGPERYKAALMSGADELGEGTLCSSPAATMLFQVMHRAKGTIAASPLRTPLRRSIGKFHRYLDSRKEG